MPLPPTMPSPMFCPRIKELGTGTGLVDGGIDCWHHAEHTRSKGTHPAILEKKANAWGINMLANAPFRATRFGPIATQKTERTDGTILLNAPHPLEAYPARLTERLVDWAQAAPERVFIARRSAQGNTLGNPLGEWQTLTYAETLARVRSLAQALLDQQFPSQRTIAIFENSLNMQCWHWLHCTWVFPTPICPPIRCSQISANCATCADDTGLIFAFDGQRYSNALQIATTCSRRHPCRGQKPACGLALYQLCRSASHNATDAVEAAFAQVTPDTVAKVLFTRAPPTCQR